MKLSIRALTIVSSFLWGGGVLLVGLMNLASPSYGLAFLQLVSSVIRDFAQPAPSAMCSSERSMRSSTVQSADCCLGGCTTGSLSDGAIQASGDT